MRFGTWSLLVRVICLNTLLAVPGMAGAANIVTNGSFELGNFVANAPFNYDVLAAGSTDLTGWAVLPNGIAWGVNPTDATPASGTAFVDLSGAFNPPTVGGIEQVLNTMVGAQYLLSFDSLASVAAVHIDSQPVLLSPGTPFTINGTTWTPQLASFSAKSSQTTLEFLNVTPASLTVGVDAVAVVEVVTTPEPAGLPLLVAPILVLVLVRLFSKTRGQLVPGYAT
jgi:hypothetical protein